MQKILGKRVGRELRENVFRYLALFLIIVLGMYIIVSMVGASEMIIQNVERGHVDNRLEDGQFSVFVPLSAEEWKQIEAAGVTLEKSFSMDYHVEMSTLRIYTLREKMNRFALTEGRHIAGPEEILLEQQYARANKLEVGSVISVGDREFEVVGIGSTPDYDAVYEKMGDSSVDSEQFGTGFVLSQDYEKLRREGKSFQTEDYCYSYLLNDSMTDDELKELLQSFELDRNQVTDAYFLEMLEEAEETKIELQEGIAKLLDGSVELSDGLAELAGHNADLREASDSLLDATIANPQDYNEKTKQSLRDTKESLQGIRDFKEGVNEYTNGVHDSSVGSAKLCVGLSEVVKNNDTLNGTAESLYDVTLMQYNQGLASEEQLVAMGGLRDGIKAYTEGVKQVSLGSQSLSYGMSVLYTAGAPLKDGAEELFDGMIDSVNEQLQTNNIQATITKENFESELDRLTGSSSPIDIQMKERLQETKEMLADLTDFREGIVEYTDGVLEAAEGSAELTDGVRELQEETDEMLDEYFSYDLDNLTAFVPATDNPRVAASIDDALINKAAGMVAGVIAMILFAYVISVFVVHNIEQESSVIGALYALGVKRRQLLLHYLVLPVVITFLGGVIGCVLGFSPIGVGSQAQDALAYFSMPVPKPVYPTYLLVYGLLMPPAMAAMVNVLVISKKLKRTALSLMRGEEKVRPIKEISLGNMSFVGRFRIRQMLRELRSAAAIVGGMFICLMVLMIGINCYVLCTNFQNAGVEETAYEYLYSYKYPTKEVPQGGTPAYMESLKKDFMGYQLEVSVLGLTEENPYYDIVPPTRKNEIVVSSAVATKFGVKRGEKLVLTDEVNDRDYAFTVVDVTPYDSALYVFMDLQAMLELFGQEEDYYNVVFADRALPIEQGRLYATVSKQSIREASDIFLRMMWPLISMTIGVSAVIFVVVMYLMMKVMIDRAAFPIALMKVFGYRGRELNKLYLDGNFIMVAVGALLCIPGAKWLIDALYPYLISNVAMGMDLTFTWQMYAGIYGAIIALYLVINRLLAGRLQKVNLAEVLKNRE